mmetsp:Transcript_65641/g.150438  ORF Transcript_65641/g.150438 Transcript_65641/m.150438 type:complete len:249 (+) Transcript_65641:59-805(+)
MGPLGHLLILVCHIHGELLQLPIEIHRAQESPAPKARCNRTHCSAGIPSNSCRRGHPVQRYAADRPGQPTKLLQQVPGAGSGNFRQLQSGGDEMCQLCTNGVSAGSQYCTNSVGVATERLDQSGHFVTGHALVAADDPHGFVHSIGTQKHLHCQYSQAPDVILEPIVHLPPEDLRTCKRHRATGPLQALPRPAPLRDVELLYHTPVPTSFLHPSNVVRLQVSVAKPGMVHVGDGVDEFRHVNPALPRG